MNVEESKPAPEPGAITAIREQARRAGRYAVALGVAEVAPVSVETIASLKLRVGAELDARALAELVAASAATRCYDHAIDALARRPRATRDLERWLLQRDHPREAIAAAVEKLTALGLLDDKRFAEAYVAGPARAKGFGSRRVAAELRRRGVAGSVVDRTLAEQREEANGEEGERDALHSTAQRRARAMRSLTPDVAQRRLTGWLVRRGYGPGESARAAREALATQDDS